MFRFVLFFSPLFQTPDYKKTCLWFDGIHSWDFDEIISLVLLDAFVTFTSFIYFQFFFLFKENVCCHGSSYILFAKKKNSKKWEKKPTLMNEWTKFRQKSYKLNQSGAETKNRSMNLNEIKWKWIFCKDFKYHAIDLYCYSYTLCMRKIEWKMTTQYKRNNPIVSRPLKRTAYLSFSMCLNHKKNSHY